MKRYLLDTHLLLWTVAESKKVPEKARDIINDDDNNIVYYSIISLWEAEIKRIKRPSKIPELSPNVLAKLCYEAGFELLPLEVSHVCLLETLTRPDNAPPHNDPFDRMLIAQAKAEDMILLTHDALIPYYNEPCIMFV